jgi:Tol biopolymer transport system component
MDPSSKVTQLTSDATYDSWWAKPSPDGSQILFYRTPAGVHDTNYAETSLWMMNSDGSDLHEVLAIGANGWSLQGHAEWSPDGAELVMFGNESVWITDTIGKLIKEVATGIDPTFTPDGKRVVYISCSDLTNCQPSDFRVFRVNVDGSGITQLENLPYRANDPSTSPDGSTIVWETNVSGSIWDIASMNEDGSNASILFSDSNINTDPTWSPSNAIFFTKTDSDEYTGYGLWIMNRDASGLQWVSQGQAGSNEYVSVLP